MTATPPEEVPFLSLKQATQELRGELDAALSRVVGSGHYIGGPEVEAFEREFAEYVGAKHCIGVGNGLDAITLSLLAHGIGKGDKVLVPSNTFIATWLGASHAGAIPVPLEPDWQSHVLSSEAAARALEGVRACVPVHLYGLPVDLPSFRRLCAERDVVLVDDAAQAHGAIVGGKKVGGFGNTTTWSFYPGKNLGALGDAGAVTTDDDGVAERIRRLRNYGSQVKYEHETVGYNSRLDPIQAAVLRVKLRHLDGWNARRRDRAAQYDRGLSGLGDLQLPSTPAGRVHAFHLYVVRTSRRDALRAHLDKSGIGTIIHYPKPPHLQTAYAQLSLDRTRLQETERASAEVLSLPMGPHLSPEQVEQVIDSIRRFFGSP
jgi:dTDP-4-amino-4,6-dideoxygalactose transaminase